MRIYNTLSGKKEEFVPINEGKVHMYACGITVSGEAHIGHGYQALIYDIMRKFLQKIGYDVTYARNYTDVDDKIIAKAQLVGMPADEYAKMIEDKINQSMKNMKIDDPNIWLKATENIDNIISFIQALIAKGNAYPAENGDVYFDVSSFKNYGCLSHRKVEDMIDGVRIDNSEEKRNVADFALWKSAKPGEIFWDSPWGKGRPGWHIECSAMNKTAFGEQIDIHGGGRDLIFPHHENEIAQTEALTGKNFAKYWTHNGLIKINGQKMSKSLGNSLLLDDLMKDYSCEAIKFALLQTNYRNDINITDDLFANAESHLIEFYTIKNNVEKLFPNQKSLYPEIDNDFVDVMSDDFNTALALSNLYRYFKEIKNYMDKKDDTAKKMVNQIKDTYSIVGLFGFDSEEYLSKYVKKQDEIPQEIVKIAEQRWSARLNKDWIQSDELRTQLIERGYEVLDSKDGYKLKKM